MPADRRQFLAAASLAAGGPLLSPIVARLHAEAAGQPLPKRLVFVVEGNGVPWHQLQPTGIERNKKLVSKGSYTSRSNGEVREGVTDVPLADQELPRALEPVNAFKDRLTILQGLSGKMNGGGHSNDFGALGAYMSKGGGAASALDATIDFVLGQKLQAVFPQIGLGISDRPDHAMIYNTSAAGPAKPLPTQCRPDLAYHGLFGFAADRDSRRAFDTKKNLLDFVAADIKQAGGALGAAEREKLDDYLGAFEGMRERHGKLVELEAVVRKNSPPVTDKFSSDVETDRLDAHFDLAFGALAAGLTNVVTLASGCGNPYFSVKFTGLGIDFGKHGIGHGGKYKNMTADEMSTTIRRFHFELIARLAKKLDSVREGDGTMLDNTLIVYLSDAAEGHHSRCWEWPMVLLGTLGGRIKAGRYLELPGHGAKGHQHLGNLYTTLLHAAGHPQDTFGHPDPLMAKDVDQSGPISELLV